VTADDFPLYAELWREQVDADELAGLRAMAGKVERTARRRRLAGAAIAGLCFGLVGFLLWVRPASLPAGLASALLAAAILRAGWHRHLAAGAARAAAIRDPRRFFEKAIGDARAQATISTIAILFLVPALIFCLMLMSAARGIDASESVRHEVSGNPAKTAIVAAAYVLAAIYLMRANARMRAQVRRLESMSREWDELRAGEAEGG